MKRVLIACEFSGVVREAFKNKGWDAWSCDLEPSEIEGQHYQCDVMNVLDKNWDMMIAFPPCTRLCRAGVHWLDRKNLWDEMFDSAYFFKELLECPIRRIAIENPIPHGYAVDAIGRKYDQIIQPWQFGHGETKATCLWLKNLPKLKPTDIVKGREPRVYMMPERKSRAKDRSRTYQGIADAMAEQWS